GWAEGYMFHQPDLERVLRNAVAARPLVQVRAGVEVSDVAIDDDGAHLTLRDADATTSTMDASWVIGCDGARSSVRRHMPDTTLAQLGPDARWLVVDLEDLSGPPLPPFTMQYCD